MGNTESNFGQWPSAEECENVKKNLKENRTTEDGWKICRSALSNLSQNPDINFSAICDLNIRLLSENESLKSTMEKQKYWIKHGPRLETELEQARNDLAAENGRLLQIEANAEDYKKTLEHLKQQEVTMEKKLTKFGHQEKLFKAKLRAHG